MEVLRKYLLLILSFAILIFIFKAWFLPGIITGGDFWPGYLSMNNNIPLYPYAWHWMQNNGIGGNASGLLWFLTASAISTAIFGNLLKFSIELSERFGFLYPFLIISFFSSVSLFKKIFPRNNFWMLSPLIFILNTYALMVVGGGQIFIMLAYALSPLVIYSFFKLINKFDRNEFYLKSSIFAGLTLALQIMFDIRIAYITFFGIGIYWLLKILENRNSKYFLNSLFLTLVVPGILSILIHAFWLFPTIFLRQNPLEQLGMAFTTTNAVQFFSFAKFEKSISLLQPNWPENIFGKTYFMRSEFLLIPILAYASLFFIKKLDNSKEKLYVLFFAILGLVGAFLAKGTSDPFGEIYLWMFNHVPGFMMFRDPTKWYMLVAISYSVLIPFAVWKICEWLKSIPQFSIFNFQFLIKSKIFNVLNAFLLLIIFYLLFLIRPALLGQLTGTFKSTVIPTEYIKLERFLSSDNNFSRTFWVPSIQRFVFYSDVHPAVSAQNLFGLTDLKKIYTEIDKSQLLLQEAGIKYVIVPYDSQGEIFLENRRYDEKTYLQTVKDVSLIPWLTGVGGFGKIAVFEVQNPKDHFWSPNPNLKINYKYVSSVEYKVEVKNAEKGDLLIFSEGYDPKWVAVSMNKQIGSGEYGKLFNSFILNKNGDYELKIYYTPQKYVEVGLIISSVTLIFIVTFLVSSFRNGKK